jgi:hypothetical protein
MDLSRFLLMVVVRLEKSISPEGIETGENQW